MDASFITPTPASTGLGGAADASGPAGTAPAGPRFGDIFTSVQPAAERQEFAAGLLGADLSMPQLVSQPLGSTLAVITPNSPTPDQASLLAFARSQGLDESAIAALWQAPQGTPSAATSAITAVTAAPPGMPTTANPTPTAGNPATEPSAAAAPALTTGQVVVLGLTLGAPAAAQAAAQTEAQTPQPTELDALALQQMRVNFLSQNGRRAERTPSFEAAPSAPPPSIGSPRTPETPPVLSLDLESELADLMQAADEAASPALAQDGASAPAPHATPHEGLRSGGQTSASGTQASAAPPPVISGYQLKAEHYQQLADRMGQALAQRVQEQFERGQWSMTLRLNPAELGQIDVQLDMHQGGLDARFMADNAITRDLIMQGSGRLKDSLSEHGMTVASVWVNSDGSRQSGENPTPQQQRRPASDTAQASTSNTSADARVSKPRRPDGWDLLA